MTEIVIYEWIFDAFYKLEILKFPSTWCGFDGLKKTTKKIICYWDCRLLSNAEKHNEKWSDSGLFILVLVVLPIFILNFTKEV